MEDDFISFDASDQASNSLFESDFLESAKRETPCSIGQSGLTLHYWLGKKYLQYILAQQMVRRHPHATVNEIDASFENLLRSYPYRQVVDELRARGLARSQFERMHTDDCYETLVTTIGYVLIQNLRPEKQDLAAILRRLGSTEIGSETSASSAGVHSQPGKIKAEEDTAAVAVYSSMLGQYADKIRCPYPEYDLRLIASQPQVFKATLIFQNVSFEAEGFNKRQAKHLTARKACNHFGICTS